MTSLMGGKANSPLRRSLLAVVAIALQSAPPTRAETLPDDPQQLQAIVFKSARTGDADMMAQLLHRGIDINLHDETGQTPLITAALAGRDDIARLLIDNKADVMARTQNGMTALHAAAYAGDVEIAQMLIAHGADVNDQANVASITPLHAAAEEDHPAVVKQLVKAGADVSRLEVNGYSAGSRAGWREHWEVVRVLLRSGDTCQPEAVAGAWLHDKCTHLNPADSN
jgi:uncharacterized protein